MYLHDKSVVTASDTMVTIGNSLELPTSMRFTDGFLVIIWTVDHGFAHTR